jgi:NUMOD4 motif
MTDSNERAVTLPPAGDELQRPETWRPVAPIDGCTYSGYEASDQGRYRSVDRKQGNRQLRGKVLATRRNEDGYVLVNLRCDSADPEHNRVHTLSGHRVTLYTFAGPPGPGQEACHSTRGPAFNWWPEGIRWDSRPANHADQVAAGTATMPAYPCRNAARCGGTVKTPGRRCAPCVAEVGADTVTLLRAGMGLPDLVTRYGFRGDDWLYRLAVEHGYEGSKAQARGQRPGLLQRVNLARIQRKCHAS